MDRLPTVRLATGMTTLILGGTGKTGRRVAHRLETQGRSVRRAARSGGDVTFDLDDPATWQAALDGVSAAYLVKPDLEPSPQIPDFAAQAVKAGVTRLVLLSAPGGDQEAHPLHGAEQAVRGSGAEWTIVRPTWFAQNFSEAFWRPGIQAGTLALPAGDGRAPFVDAEDIAEVAAAALTGDGHAGRVYELTGPRAIGFAEAVELIGRAAGRTIRYVDADPDEFTAQQISFGVPARRAEAMTRLFTGMRDERSAALTDGVRQALGKDPRSFEDFVARADWT